MKRLKRFLGFDGKATTKYAHFVENEAVDSNSILLESRHGSAFEGNMFHLARWLLTHEEYRGFTIYVPVRESRRQLVESQVALLPGKVQLISYGSVEYMHALACCKYLFNDTSFLHCFYKREDQIYVNTWHGTPLKYLGRGVEAENIRMGNVQRNFLCADYILFPNRHTHDAIINSYMLGDLFSGKAVFSGYPRNEVFFDSLLRETVREQFDLNGKTVYAFMPTYRGRNNALHKDQFAELRDYLNQLDQMLLPNEVVFLNLHPFMKGAVTCDGLNRIKLFPDSIPTYDFLAATDGLITDYSSVMFDYACSSKPIVLFAYDREHYASERGMYFDLSTFLLPVVDRVEDVLPELRKGTGASYASFQNEYCRFDNSRSSGDLLDLVIKGDECNVVVADAGEKKRRTCLVMIDGIDPEGIAEVVADHFDDPDLSRYHYFVSFFRTNADASLIPDAISKKIDYFALGGKTAFSGKERVVERAYRLGVISPERYVRLMSKMYRREWQRRYGNTRFDSVVSLGVYSSRRAFLTALQPGKNEIVVSERYRFGNAALAPSDSERSFIASRVTVSNASEVLEGWLSSPKLSSGIRMSLVAPFFSASRHKGLRLFSLMRIVSRYPHDLKTFRIEIGDRCYFPKVVPVRSKDNTIVSGSRWVTIDLDVPASDLHEFSIQNYIKGQFALEDHVVGEKSISYCFFRRKYRSAHGCQLIDRRNGTNAFFRQTKKGNLALTVRNLNVTDSVGKKVKLKVAWAISRFLPSSGSVLLYEKNASKYEEGAKIVFQYLIDSGYRNVKFVVDKATFDSLVDVPKRYKDHMVVSHSWKHYITFFRTNVFIGTETLAHSLELRVQERRAQEKLNSGDIKYVFLQHGPTYMVSLDSPQRTFFRRGEVKGEMYIAVNSEKERNHFIELGGFDDENLLMCGMPKFDGCVLDDDADLITVMPTWRAWEFNEVRFSPETTSYWKMIQRIKRAIPDDLQDKIVVQAHPLFNRSEDGTIKQERSIDELLRHTKVLITDYSSVSYDAFYRGSNVVYYWEEMESCMEKYGYPTHLMIDESTAPGYVCYSPDELRCLIREAYDSEQPRYQIHRFREIVSFHDGNNTKRLVDMLKSRNVL